MLVRAATATTDADVTRTFTEPATVNGSVRFRRALKPIELRKRLAEPAVRTPAVPPNCELQFTYVGRVRPLVPDQDHAATPHCECAAELDAQPRCFSDLDPDDGTLGVIVRSRA